MDKLRVRVYNVRFGDAILISIPDRGIDGITKIKHILIDVGNSVSGEGGANEVFIPVVNNILEVLDGQGLDLYIMTHEHMDHVQGLLYADKNTFNMELSHKLGVKYAWFTGSSALDYYGSHPKAKEKNLQMTEAYTAIEHFLGASDEPSSPMVASLLGINNSGITDDCVNYLRGLAPVDKTHYIYRGVNLEGMHNFQETQFEIWAPEEDTSDYYGPMLPLALGLDSRSVDTTKPTMVRPIPPAGVDAGAFYNLISLRKQGWMDNLLAIDQAANNTSVVFCLEWRNWKLLFPGDAELRSWKIMAREKMLRPVDFLKVGHHGSHNATPPEELFDLIMEKSPTHKRRAVVSTYDHTYSNVPDEEGTLAKIKSRAVLRDTRTLKDGEWFDIEFEG